MLGLRFTLSSPEQKSWWTDGSLEWLWTAAEKAGLVIGLLAVGANIARLCPRWLTLGLIALLVVANTINIAADLGAMGDAVHLLAGGHASLYVIGFGLLSVAGQVFFSYERTVRILKWLTLALFSYVAVILSVSVPWPWQERWSSWTTELWSDVKQLLRVRTVTAPEALLLSPEQAFFARDLAQDPQDFVDNNRGQPLGWFIK